MWVRIAAATILGIGALGAAIWLMPGKQPPFESICYEHHRKYNPGLCADVGKSAYPLASVSVVNKSELGKIAGVAWRNKDNIISRPGEVKRYSEKNDYYYIVCSNDSPDSCMLQLNTDVRVR